MSVGGRSVNEEDVQYADHEFQTIRMQAFEVSGDAADQASTRLYEPLGGNLQNDELAELVSIRGTLQCEVNEDPAEGNQSEAGTYGGQAEIGINTTGDERATSDMRDPNFGDEDSPAILYILQTGTGTSPFVDTSAGAGGGGGSPQQNGDFNFRDHFGTGPFLDKADEISVRTEVESKNTVLDVVAEAYWILGYRVYEIESQRPTFGAGD